MSTNRLFSKMIYDHHKKEIIKCILDTKSHTLLIEPCNVQQTVFLNPANKYVDYSHRIYDLVDDLQTRANDKADTDMNNPRIAVCMMPEEAWALCTQHEETFSQAF